MLQAGKILKEQINNLDSLIANLDQILKETVEDSLPLVEGLNRAQMFKGERSDGRKISDPPGQPYTAYTKRVKKSKGQPTDRVTLKDTGDFYDGVGAVLIWPKEIAVRSVDPKSPKLTGKYSPLIFGLNDDFLKTYIELLCPEIQIEIRKRI